MLQHLRILYAVERSEGLDTVPRQGADVATFPQMENGQQSRQSVAGLADRAIAVGSAIRIRPCRSAVKGAEIQRSAKTVLLGKSSELERKKREREQPWLAAHGQSPEVRHSEGQNSPRWKRDPTAENGVAKGPGGGSPPNGRKYRELPRC